MQVATPSVEAVAEAYGITRQRLHQLRRGYGFELSDFTNPGRIFDTLLDHGRSCPLRDRLRCPITRAVIVEELNLSAMRGPRVSTENKINSIR